MLHSLSDFIWDRLIKYVHLDQGRSHEVNILINTRDEFLCIMFYLKKCLILKCTSNVCLVI